MIICLYVYVMTNGGQVLSLGSFFLQDVILVNYSPDMFFKNRALAIARKHLKQKGISGLHQAPCFRGLLQRLPTMLQDQFSHEKVRPWPE